MRNTFDGAGRRVSPSEQVSASSGSPAEATGAPSGVGRAFGDPVVAFMSPDTEAVVVARSILKSAGVPYWSRAGGPRSGIVDGLATSILVAPADVADAKALLADLQRSEDEAARRIAQGIPDPAASREEQPRGLWYLAPALMRVYWWFVAIAVVGVIGWQLWRFLARHL